MSFADMWSARHVQIGVGKTSCPKMGSAVGHQHANEMASSPVLSTADTLSFIPCVDCALIVVEDDVTKETELKQTVDLLSVTNIIGTVLNKAKY